MRVLNKGKSIVRVSRGNYTVGIAPGINTLPAYDWITLVVSKNPNLETILDIEYTATGTVSDKSKVINKDKKIAVKKIDKEPTTTKVDTPKKRRRKKAVNQND